MICMTSYMILVGLPGKVNPGVYEDCIVLAIWYKESDCFVIVYKGVK